MNFLLIWTYAFIPTGAHIVSKTGTGKNQIEYVYEKHKIVVFCELQINKQLHSVNMLIRYDALISKTY